MNPIALPAIDAARQWLDAITARDKLRLLTLSHPLIRIHGPAGAGVGHDVLSQWFDAMPMRITVLQSISDGRDVHVRHRIEWLDANGGVEHVLENDASVGVEHGLVTSYRRSTGVSRSGR